MPSPPPSAETPTVHIICPYPLDSVESVAWYQGLEAGVGLAKAVIEAILPCPLNPQKPGPGRQLLMTRRQQSKRWRYANRQGKPAAWRGPSFDADLPVAGFYQVRLRQNGPPVALHIWHGPPLDPETLEPMDRAPRWLAMINGVSLVDVFQFWPACARRPIDRAEFKRIVERSRTLDKDDPYFDPLRPIDRLKTPMPF